VDDRLSGVSRPSSAPSTFETVCEIEPPTRPDLTRVRHQIGVLTPVADAFLVPDNHLGRATVSSVSVAAEVQAMGGRSIACLNSRDRNLLGLRRDLLTAAAYGVEQFLLVFGDEPAEGGRTSDLTVRTMIDEVRAADHQPAFAGCPPFRVGVTSGLRAFPTWKRDADFVFVQVSFSLDRLLAWRETVAIDVPVYAGVMVIASAAMAGRVSATIPDLGIPDALIEAVERDRAAGVAAACELVHCIEDSGAFDGVHLVPVSRYREVAQRLEADRRAAPAQGPDPPAARRRQ
jgi:methylenetetrahydrofolate reductase (NADPH)